MWFGCLESQLCPPCFHPIEGRGGKGVLVRPCSSDPRGPLGSAPVLLHQPSFSARPRDSVSLHRDARPPWASLRRPGCRTADLVSRYKWSELFLSPDESAVPATPARGGEGPLSAGDTGIPTGVLGRPKGRHLQQVRLQHDTCPQKRRKSPSPKRMSTWKTRQKSGLRQVGAPGPGVFSFSREMLGLPRVSLQEETSRCPRGSRALLSKGRAARGLVPRTPRAEPHMCGPHIRPQM